jgi:hypothetical protein
MPPPGIRPVSMSRLYAPVLPALLAGPAGPSQVNSHPSPVRHASPQSGGGGGGVDRVSRAPTAMKDVRVHVRVRACVRIVGGPDCTGRRDQCVALPKLAWPGPARRSVRARQDGVR